MKGYRLPLRDLPGMRLADAKERRRHEPLRKARLRLWFRWNWAASNAACRWSMAPRPVFSRR
jgi:hypothetical protein